VGRRCGICFLSYVGGRGCRGCGDGHFKRLLIGPGTSCQALWSQAKMWSVRLRVGGTAVLPIVAAIGLVCRKRREVAAEIERECITTLPENDGWSKGVSAEGV
jgi:hypothetical protein